MDRHSDGLRDLRVILAISQAERDAIDDWRFAHRIASRSEAIRALIRAGLEATQLSDRDRAKAIEAAVKATTPDK